MKSLSWFCAAMVVSACGTDHNADTGQPGGTNDGGTQMEPPGDAPPAPATCPIGLADFQRTLGDATLEGNLDVAIDSRGNPLVAASELGVVELSPRNEPRFIFAHGSVVAVGPRDHIFVAGAFTAPTDFGTGTITPQGNIDTFLVELDADGNALAARSLNLCGDGVSSIAVDPAGRVAVSGSALGTVVFSPAGAIDFQLAYSGDVAFDAAGNLAVVGTFASIDLGDGIVTVADNGTDAFAVELDTHGSRMWSRILTGGGALGRPAVTFDGAGNLVFVAATATKIDVFGTTVTAKFASESGRISGGFLVVADATGRALLVQDAFMTEANGIAVTPNSDLVVNGTTAGNTAFFKHMATARFAANGELLGLREEFVASGDGGGLGIVVDACGNPYASYVASDTVFPGSPLRSYLVKLGPP